MYVFDEGEGAFLRETWQRGRLGRLGNCLAGGLTRCLHILGFFTSAHPVREALGVGHGGDSTTAPAKLAYLQPVLQNVASQRIVGRREAHDANLKRGEPAEKPPLPQVRGDAEQ